MTTLLHLGLKFFLPLTLACTLSPLLYAQQSPGMARLPQSLLDIGSPASRVQGEVGTMRIIDRSCRESPTQELRRRIVDAAVQEWAWFGFSTDVQARTPPPQSGPRGPFVYPRLSPEESARVASSIAGYWAAIPNSDWILQRQNSAWQTEGAGVRWRDAWSAAFISWVMCEAGVGDSAAFQRAIAHHSYIDQAILASETADKQAAYRAYALGSAAILPGDLLCRGSRPAYSSIAQRRAQLGEGARTHCDIVVKVDDDAQQISVIGGNVRATVRMKILPATRDASPALRPIADNGRPLFVHLQLQAPQIEANALEHSPSWQALACQPQQRLPPLSLLVAESTTDC